jgi:hypothetical protein
VSSKPPPSLADLLEASVFELAAAGPNEDSSRRGFLRGSIRMPTLGRGLELV